MASITKRELFLGAAGLGVGVIAGKTLLEPLGTGDDWGPGPAPSTGANFKPKSICIVHLKFDRREIAGTPGTFAPTFSARHVWFDATGGDEKADLRLAVEKFKEIMGLLPPPGDKPQWPPVGAKRPSEGFKNFNFGGSSRIYFYVEDQPHVTFDHQNLIQFTKYAADHLPGGGKKKMQKNKSFPPAKIIKQTDTGLPGEILYLENLFKKYRFESIEMGEEDIKNPEGGPAREGNAPKQPFLEYSMNIHLRMKMSDGSTIPLIIDPNTGNGGGWEP